MPFNRSKEWVAVPHQFEGVSLNIGVGLGKAVLHQSYEPSSAREEDVVPKNHVKAELDNLNQAFIHLNDEINELIADRFTSSKKPTRRKHESESKDILETYRLLANDPAWKGKLIHMVESGMSPLEAVDESLNVIRETFNAKGKDTIWQQRIGDFEDLAARLKRHISKEAKPTAIDVSDSPIIVVADRIGPAELLDYDRDRLAGLVLVEHSQTSHVAIVARSLDIPVVGEMKNAMQDIQSGDLILIDGYEGRLYLNPSNDVVRRFDLQTLIKKAKPTEIKLEKLATLPSTTLDDVPISLFLNAGLVEDVDHIEAAGAQGIGLYRTEIPFMMRPRLPNVEEQTNLYREIMNRAGNHPVIFRTLDVGGDKVLPSLERLKSDNPMRKERITHVFFDRPILLRYQLRAFIRACEGGDLRIMLPMVAEVDEIKTARDLLDREIERERAQGNPTPSFIKLGAMIEVPSLIYQLPQLFPYVDFLSVGSNDLFQFFYAIDREHPKVSERYDVLSSTFLCLLSEIQQACRTANMPLSICGEMAGRPLEALALIGLGFQTLSMSAASVPMVKTLVRSLRYQEISHFMESICVPGRGSVRQELRDFVKEKNIHCE
jgi:phosphotransferase system enzyme I (PtsP)